MTAAAAFGTTPASAEAAAKAASKAAMASRRLRGWNSRSISSVLADGSGMALPDQQVKKTVSPGPRRRMSKP